MAEEDFVSVVVANARVQTWVNHILSPEQPARRLQAMHALSAAIQSDTVYAEEAPQWNLPPQLTRMLATTEDEELMGAIASLLAALSGATVHSERVVRVGYPEIGELQVSEAALGLGVGARLWGIAHRINTMLIAQRAVVAGRRVLELGSGVGSTGVTLAKLGASQVVLTDVVPEVLHNLRRTLHLNAPPLSRRTPPQSPASADEAFSDAETVSDDGELFGGSAEAPASESQSGGGGAWQAGNMAIRLLDWKRELDLLEASAAAAAAAAAHDHAKLVDETTSSLDRVRIDAPLRTAPPRESTFDEPGESADLPPELPQGDVFPFVVGCEVLYEMPHARWLAAALRRRLAPGGQAVVVGAVRDVQVYVLFERCLNQHGLPFEWAKVAPLEDFPGTTLGNKEADYEGGYRMYVVEAAESAGGEGYGAPRFKLITEA